MLATGLAAGAAYFLVSTPASLEVQARYALAPALPLTLAAIPALGALAVFRVRDGWLAWGATLASVLVVIGVVVYPRIDATRSGRAFVEEVARAARDVRELGLVGAKEQYLLHLARPSVNFGHARWRERDQEAADAAAWFVAQPGRALLVDEKALEACFANAQSREVARANRQTWHLVVGGAPDRVCIERGDLRRARLYVPSNASINSAG